jgi:hypothetical protein
MDRVTIGLLAVHVRFGSKADIEARPVNVCFTPKSGHKFISAFLEISLDTR